MTLIAYALSIFKAIKIFLHKSIADIGINKKEDKTPKPGVQGPLGESLFKIKIVANAIK